MTRTRPRTATLLAALLLTASLLLAVPTPSDAQLACPSSNPTPVQWDDGGSDTSLTNPLNWGGDAVPVATDVACIGVNGGGGVDLGSGSFAVLALHSSRPVGIQGGTMSLRSGLSTFENGLTVTGGTLDLSTTADITMANDLVVGTGARLAIGIAGTDGQNSFIVDDGSSEIAGEVLVRVVDFIPQVGDIIQFLASDGAATVSGSAIDGNPGDGIAWVLEADPLDDPVVQVRAISEPPPPPPPLTVSLADVQVDEGDDGTTEVELTASLSRPVGFDVDVTVEVTGVTGLEQIDFSDTPAFAQALGEIKVPAGDTAASLLLDVIGDDDPEPDETVEATIQSVVPSTVQVGQGTATVTIVDDDEAPGLDDPTLAPTDFNDTCLVDTDGLGLAKDEPLGASQVASLLVTCTPASQTDTVLIGRDDDFADSLASGFLQADSPLLLVPGAGPIPDDVRTRLTELAPRQVVILGGVDAVLPAVEEELGTLGIEVIRRAGPTRIETAIDVAATDAADATTAIVARAFPGEGDPTQAFADAIAAGGMAADLGYPVLLTEQTSLSAGTAAYLGDSAITDVLVMGGTAAVSDLAAAQIAEIIPGSVTRVAADSRAGTAIEVAKERGSDTAADVTDLIVVEGQTEFAWAGGLAAAYASAQTGAPIVLLADGEVPPETAAYLTGEDAGPSFAVEPGEGTVICAAAGAGCLEARRLLGLDDATVEFDPPSLSPAVLGDVVKVDLPDLPEGAEVTYGGSCLRTSTEDPAEVVIRDDAGGPPLPCLVVVTITYPSGVVQTETAAYTD